MHSMHMSHVCVGLAEVEMEGGEVEQAGVHQENAEYEAQAKEGDPVRSFGLVKSGQIRLTLERYEFIKASTSGFRRRLVFLFFRRPFATIQ